uniref:Uncharacterized protein n=1 Tax=Rhizophora mucronata TaxID=61149 RepID=A0A2P2PJX5_RHIMU
MNRRFFFFLLRLSGFSFHSNVLCVMYGDAL